MAYIGKSPTGSGVRTRYYFTQTSGGGTSISGTDDNGKTLTYTDGEYVDVYLNGVSLVHGTDYGTGTANTISSLAALASGDVVEVVVYDIFNVAKINNEAVRKRYYKTASGSETSISGADDSGATITFPANAEIEVKLNGVALVQGTDYNTTSANTVGGLSALSAGQVVEVVVYERFVLGDTVSKADGGTFASAVAVNGDLTVDTSTLHVDSTNNRVGVGTASPSEPFHIVGASGAATDMQIQGGDDTNSVRLFMGGSTNPTHGRIVYSTASDFMAFSTGGDQRVRVDSDGLKFASDTAAANALDDYEEGTWTPASGIGSAPTNSGHYTKIGRLVTVYGDCTFTGSGSVSASISGLPFTVATPQTGGSVGFNNIASGVMLIASTGGNLVLYNGLSTAVDIPNSGRILFCVSYQTS